MKRLFSVFLASLLLCAAFAAPVSVGAATSATVALEEAAAETGDSVQMRLTLSGNPGLVAMLVTIHFDTKALQLTAADNGDVFPEATATFGADMTGDSFTLTWLDALSRTNYTADGLLATLTFRVLPTADAGKSTVSLTLDSSSIFNCDLQNQTVVPQNGSVQITKKVVPVTGISLSNSTLTMAVGDVYNLVATVTPETASDPSVQWSSSAPAVASVDANGKVTAKSVGSSVITATASNGSEATCTVTVNNPTVAVTGVSLSKASIALTEGESFELKATVSPGNATNPAVSWTSSAPSVASVDASGRVTAKAAGSAVITVKTADGGKTATCRVTVKAATVPVTGISLPIDFTITYNTSLRLTATVTPDNATNPAVQWSSSDPKIVEVDANGNLTTHRKGTATITATTVDGGKKATCNVTVRYTFVQKIIIYLLFGWIWYVK